MKCEMKYGEEVDIQIRKSVEFIDVIKGDEIGCQ